GSPHRGRKLSAFSALYRMGYLRSCPSAKSRTRRLRPTDLSPKLSTALAHADPWHLVGDVGSSCLCHLDHCLLGEWHAACAMRAGKFGRLSCMSQGEIGVAPAADRAAQASCQKVPALIEIECPSQPKCQHIEAKLRLMAAHPIMA